jgi:hypothetical protein
MTALLEQLGNSLANDSSDASLKKWVHYIVENNIALTDLISLLHAERKVAMRFTWLVGGLCELKPEVVFPTVSYFYSKRNEIPFPNFDRSLAKMFWLSGVPEEIEGEVIDDLFKWILDAKITVSTKVYTISALYNLSVKHIELKNELKLVIEDQLGKNSIAFEKRAAVILKKLRK